MHILFNQKLCNYFILLIIFLQLNNISFQNLTNRSISFYKFQALYDWQEAKLNYVAADLMILRSVLIRKVHQVLESAEIRRTQCAGGADEVVITFKNQSVHSVDIQAGECDITVSPVTFLFAGMTYMASTIC
ncbi:UNVERIFIED_CONTAM: hypothetical protein NCL1_08415 [Trichonephila clavipes]